MSNLSLDGKAWYLHPVGMGAFVVNEKIQTWDAITNSRILFLHPKIRQCSINFINDVEDEFGIKLRIVQGYRTIDEQNRIYAQGRTLPGKKVTWVKGGYSYHNYGLAIDVVEIKDNKANWDENVLIQIAPIGKKNGFLWGGDWVKNKDYPHFEMNFGFKTSELLIKYDNGEFDDENYIKID